MPLCKRCGDSGYYYGWTSGEFHPDSQPTKCTCHVGQAVSVRRFTRFILDGVLFAGTPHKRVNPFEEYKRDL